MNSDVPRNANGVRAPLVVGLGEALFDCFAESKYVGGAPVNLAVHCDALLREFGGRAVVASAIGDDVLGQKFAAFLAERLLDTRFIQVSPDRPTGSVLVTVDGRGEPSYVIEEDVAWDHLQYEENWRQLASTCAAVSFGTLAQRSPASCATIVQFLRDAGQAVRLFDVNLRQEYYSTDVIQLSLELATAAKLNLDELRKVSRMLGITSANVSNSDGLVSEIMARFDLDWIAVTRGSQGTALYVGQKKFEGVAPKYDAADGADNVGAGDACGAGLLIGALLGWPYERWVAMANDLGAYVCSRRGAIPTLPKHLLSSTDTDRAPSAGDALVRFS